MTGRTMVLVAALAALTLSSAVGPAIAQQGEWQFRAHVVAVTSSDDSGPIADLGTVLTLGAGPGLVFDSSYGLTHTLSASMALTGSYHTLDTSKGVSGGLTAGKVWLGSLALSLQYRPGLMGPWHPYLGAGITYGEPFGFDLDDQVASIGLTAIKFDGDLGYLLQAGVMYDLGPKWFLDLGISRHTLTTEARLTVDPGLHYATVEMDLDPWRLGLGVGKRF